jgi:hypothetical protein
MKNKIITLCFWKRPDYAREVLSSLERCFGIQNYTLLIHLDGHGHKEIPSVAKSVDFAERVVVRHGDHLGCNETTRRALSHGFNESDYVIHVEEDVAIAPDSLRWFEWTHQFGSRSDIFTSNAWRHDVGWLPESGVQCPDGEGEKASIIPFFNCWGWATWIDRWREMESRWTPGGDHSLSWDVRLSEIRGNRHGIQPHISRAVNIGEHGGTHRGACGMSYWAGADGFNTSGNYTLL